MWAFIQACGLIIVLVGLFIGARFRDGDGELDVGMGHRQGDTQASRRRHTGDCR